MTDKPTPEQEALYSRVELARLCLQTGRTVFDAYDFYDFVINDERKEKPVFVPGKPPVQE